MNRRHFLKAAVVFVAAAFLPASRAMGGWVKSGLPMAGDRSPQYESERIDRNRIFVRDLQTGKEYVLHISEIFPDNIAVTITTTYLAKYSPKDGRS